MISSAEMVTTQVPDCGFCTNRLVYPELGWGSVATCAEEVRLVTEARRDGGDKDFALHLAAIRMLTNRCQIDQQFAGCKTMSCHRGTISRIPCDLLVVGLNKTLNPGISLKTYGKVNIHHFTQSENFHFGPKAFTQSRSRVSLEIFTFHFFTFFHSVWLLQSWVCAPPGGFRTRFSSEKSEKSEK